jgi:hypothetical protein
VLGAERALAQSVIFTGIGSIALLGSLVSRGKCDRFDK